MIVFVSRNYTHRDTGQANPVAFRRLDEVSHYCLVSITFKSGHPYTNLLKFFYIFYGIDDRVRKSLEALFAIIVVKSLKGCP